MPPLTAVLFTITLGAWGLLLYRQQHMLNQPMSEMWMPPTHYWQWSLSDFAVIYSMWAVMMAAMMLPSALPMINAYGHASRRRHHSEMPYTPLFMTSYLLVWFGFSILLTLLQWQFHSVGWLSPMMDNNNPLLAAAIFVLAGLYQFTPLKNSCLNHCQSPIGFLLNHWQSGRRGALVMGMTHGLHCLGCCWAQMLIMFAVGVMNVGGMVLLTLFMLVEKNLPPNQQLPSKISGILLCFWGIWLLTR